MERTPLLLEFKKKLAFHGGVLNVNTPREGAWLPKRLRSTHSDAPFARGPRGKRKKRAGHPLRDEPLRHGLESLDLTRADLLLLDHDKHT